LLLESKEKDLNTKWRIGFVLNTSRRLEGVMKRGTESREMEERDHFKFSHALFLNMVAIKDGFDTERNERIYSSEFKLQ